MKKRENKLSNFFKIGILLVGISLSLWNCENDYEIGHSHHHSLDTKTNYKIEKIGYSELIADKEIKNSLPKIRQKFSKNKKHNIQNKNTVQVSEYFAIITDSIHKVTSKNVITWAFKIKTPVLKTSDFENFLVKKQDEKFSYFLVSYEKKSEKEYKKAILYPIAEKFLNLNNLKLSSRGVFENDDEGSGGGGGGCPGRLVYDNCSVGGAANGHSPALQADGITKCSGSPLLYIDFSHCPNGGVSTPSNPSNTNVPDNNNNGGGSSGNSNGGSTITTPVTFECDNCSNALSLISYLNLTDQNQINWVNDSNNTKTVDKLLNFVNSNNNSTQAQNFAKSAIEALINNGKVDFDDEIINNLKNEASCVYKKMKNNSLLRKTLKEFNGKDAPVHLVLKEDDLNNGTSGETKYGDMIEITLDRKESKNTPALWVAHTILHESIHADIYRKIRTRGGLFLSNGIYTLNGKRADFPTLFDYYDKYPQNPQHNYMADYYRKAMEKGLREYAKSTGKIYPEQLYKDLAWAGLHNTNAWKNMYKDPIYTKNEQIRISKVFKKFKKSGKNDCK